MCMIHYHGTFSHNIVLGSHLRKLLQSKKRLVNEMSHITLCQLFKISYHDIDDRENIAISNAWYIFLLHLNPIAALPALLDQPNFSQHPTQFSGISLVLTWSLIVISHIPQTPHLCYVQFFSTTSIFHILEPYNAVGTTTLSYNFQNK